jgi:CHAT domain-containing protein
VGLTSLTLEYDALLAKGTRTPGEDARMSTLDTRIEAENEEILTFFRKTIYPELKLKVNETADANDLLSRKESQVTSLQNVLRSLGNGVMGIRLLLGDEHVFAIVVTRDAQKKFELPAKPAILREKVSQAREELRSHASDPRQHLKELYGMVVAPLEGELKDLEQNSPTESQVPTLLWSLDGAMRYLPMPAMYDGQLYLLERFDNVLFTPESYAHIAFALSAEPGNLNVLAWDCQRATADFPHYLRGRRSLRPWRMIAQIRVPIGRSKASCYRMRNFRWMRRKPNLVQEGAIQLCTSRVIS